MSDEKSLFFEADTCKHQQLVMERMAVCAKRITNRGLIHDASKFSDIERTAYEEPVWLLNTGDIEYGSEEYKRLTAQMGEGWKHHKANNDHHPEYFERYKEQASDDPIQAMDFFALIEMLCDWIAAARRKSNKPSEAIKYLKEKYPLDPQMEAVLRNTLAVIEVTPYEY